MRLLSGAIQKVANPIAKLFVPLNIGITFFSVVRLRLNCGDFLFDLPEDLEKLIAVLATYLAPSFSICLLGFNSFSNSCLGFSINFVFNVRQAVFPIAIFTHLTSPFLCGCPKDTVSWEGA